MQEKRIRSVVKSISWRVTGTLDTIMIAFLITGDVKPALAIGGIEVVTKMTLYYFHERIWDRLKFGRVTEEPDYQI